jgi:serine/threonine-protein kinase
LTELATRQQEGAPDPLHQLNPEVPPALSRAVSRALAPTREHRYAAAAEFGEAIRQGARGRDSAVTTLLETQATQVADDTARTTVLPAPAPSPVAAAPSPAPAAPVRPRGQARRAPAPRREPKPRRRRGAFTRFMALMFLFLLIATVVAAIVIANVDSGGTQDFERVVGERVQDQIDGIRKLIDDATK